MLEGDFFFLIERSGLSKRKTLIISTHDSAKSLTQQIKCKSGYNVKPLLHVKL